MGPRKLINPVETEKALYEVVFGLHFWPTKVGIEGIDGLVIETGMNLHSQIWYTGWVEDGLQYSGLASQSRVLGIPLYGVDVWSKEWPIESVWDPPQDDMLPSEDAIETLDKVKKMKMELQECVEGIKLSQSESDFIRYDSSRSEREFKEGDPTVVWRNAICAHKVEWRLVPYLMTRLGRKPHVMIVYGSAHMGIVDCLKDDKRKNLLLRDFYNRGLKHTNLMELYTISEAVFQVRGAGDPHPSDWIVNTISTEQPFALD